MTVENIGAKIDALTKLKQAYKKKYDAAEAAKKEVTKAEEELKALLVAQGMEKAGGKTATVALRSSVVFNITDWDAFYALVHKNKAYHLLQRRISEPAMRELLEMKGKIAGAEPVTKVSLGYTASK